MVTCAHCDGAAEAAALPLVCSVRACGRNASRHWLSPPGNGRGPWARTAEGLSNHKAPNPCPPLYLPLVIRNPCWWCQTHIFSGRQLQQWLVTDKTSQHHSCESCIYACACFLIVWAHLPGEDAVKKIRVITVPDVCQPLTLTSSSARGGALHRLHASEVVLHSVFHGASQGRDGVFST